MNTSKSKLPAIGIITLLSPNQLMLQRRYWLTKQTTLQNNKSNSNFDDKSQSLFLSRGSSRELAQYHLPNTVGRQFQIMVLNANTKQIMNKRYQPTSFNKLQCEKYTGVGQVEVSSGTKRTLKHEMKAEA